MMRAKARYITGCVNTAWWEVLRMQHMFTMYCNINLEVVTCKIQEYLI